ncbi:MAG: hypothetical protein DMG26_02720 [Acidobacteria bacterium]|nr:MAG: hypothetical protein DMG26_02720 [Acidobacteriota bacterium]
MSSLNVGSRSPHTPAGTWSTRKSWGSKISADFWIIEARRAFAWSLPMRRLRGYHTSVSTLMIEGILM